MTASVSDLLARLPEPAGPIAAAVAERLADLGLRAVVVGTCERSPFGGRAVRVRDEQAKSIAAMRDQAAVLRAQPWIQMVVVAPPNYYLNLDPLILERWMAREPPPPTGAGLVAIIGFPNANALRATPLDTLRLAAVARALAAMMRAVGIKVVEHEKPARQSGAFQAFGHIDLELRDGDDIAVLALEVAGVDLPQGTLRARHGGTVHVADLLAELRPLAGVRADALSRFIMLRVERSRRLTIDEGRLRSDAEAFADLQALAREQAAPVGRKIDRRDLILGLDAVAAIAHRALTTLDPYLPCRHLRTLGQACGTRLSWDDPLRANLFTAFAEGLRRLSLAPDEDAFALSTPVHQGASHVPVC